MINLDANATYGPLPEVVEYLCRTAPLYGNPSSIHRAGQRARATIEGTRDLVRDLLSLSPSDQIVFTSGATEANNTVLHSVTRSQRDGIVLTSAVEHPCILEPARRCINRHHTFRPDRELDLSAVPPIALMSCMHANNETGQIFPVSTFAKLVRDHSPSALVHTDAAQTVGKIPVAFHDLHVDALTFSGHKLGALAGVGVLVIRSDTPLHPLLLGGAQEHRLRAGTENVLGIGALGVALSALKPHLLERLQRTRQRRDQLRTLLRAGLPELRSLTPEGEGALPNTLSVTIPGQRADDLVVGMDAAGFLVSSGAACSSGKPEPSGVLTTLGLSDDDARATIRFSIRHDITESEIERAAAHCISLVQRGRRIAA